MALLDNYDLLQASMSDKEPPECPECGGKGYVILTDHNKYACKLCQGDGLHPAWPDMGRGEPDERD